ncbi:universal stress protein [Streptomyces sp. NPDC051173]|uniref:universal stress protein n=1 Tax=Streptomyces sp. NPDC051173 TaxID=3155164 RepID=UPI00344D25A8
MNHEKRPTAVRAYGSRSPYATQRFPQLKVETEVVPGDPVPALLDASREAFMVVVGWAGSDPPVPLPSASVGPEVAARACCPVVVVRGRLDAIRGRAHRVTVRHSLCPVSVVPRS